MKNNVKTKIAFGLLVSVAIIMIGCRSKSTVDNDAQQLYIGENIAVAETSYGKVRGFILRGIYNYRGIPYGAETSGKNRFMPPQKPEPWDGVRPAVFFGSSSPQDIYDRSSESYSAFVDHWNYDVLSEDCLRLNVWTPAIGDGGKRPVLVWLHGGGFSRGNGIEQDGYDGENIVRYGNIVYCSVNHRLGSLGFSDFAAVGGERYIHSGNVGMLDIVAALEWVRDNIANFGGDPDNVTIMGQSGGGSKVCMLAAMPSAKGLIHKGVALSGNSIRANDRDYAEKLGAAILEEAKLKPSQIDRLQQMPYDEYMSIAERAVAKFAARSGQRGGFSPVGNGIDIPEGEFYAADDPAQPDIPMLFCSTFHEWNPNRDNPELENVTLDEVAQRLSNIYGIARAKKIVGAYAESFPKCRPIEIWALIASNRIGIVRTADTKLGQTSPIYMAWFGMGSPLFDGRHRAFHCSDISFWFRNTDLMVTHTGGGRRPRELSDKMSQALIAFMRTGDPNCKALPDWRRYSSERGETMILDAECRLVDDPDRNARKSFEN